MKRFLILLTVLLTLLSAFSLVAFAESADGITAAEEQNFFDEAYSFVSDNSDKILSALAAIISLVLALTYRRGLLPLLKGGLGTLSGTVSIQMRRPPKRGEKVYSMVGMIFKRAFRSTNRGNSKY